MSKFSIFSSVRSQQAQDCTYEKYVEVGASPIVHQLCEAIAAEPDKEKRNNLKRQLPIITFQARFAGPRKNDLAEPRATTSSTVTVSATPGRSTTHRWRCAPRNSTSTMPA